MRNSRYRRDQRQMDEEEEMWFNEDDDFDDNEAVVPATTADILTPKKDVVCPVTKSLDASIEISMKCNKQSMMESMMGRSAKINNNSSPKSTVLNNNPTGAVALQQSNSVAIENNKSALFKRVGVSFEVRVVKFFQNEAEKYKRMTHVFIYFFISHVINDAFLPHFS